MRFMMINSELMCAVFINKSWMTGMLHQTGQSNMLPAALTTLSPSTCNDCLSTCLLVPINL